MSQKPANLDVDNTPEDSAIDDIAQSLIDGMPEPQQHAIDQHEAAQAETEAMQDISDKAGTRFNPDIHAVNDDGSPKLTANGNFAKKRGRKSGGTNSGGSTLNAGGQRVDPEQAKRQEMVIKQRAAGTMAANTLIMLGVVLGGDEWRPMRNDELGLDEKASLETAFADYFAAKGLDDIPAGYMLAIAISGYTLPRFTMPKTQQRTVTFWQKCKKWWINRKLKKHGLKAEEIDAKEKATKQED